MGKSKSNKQQGGAMSNSKVKSYNQNYSNQNTPTAQNQKH